MIFFVRFIIVFALVSQAVIAISMNIWELPDVAAASRDVAVAIGAGALFLYNKRNHYYLTGLMLLIPFLVTLLFHISASDYTLFQIMAAVRQLVAPALIIMFALMLVAQGRFFEDYGIFIVRLCVALAVFGIVERVFHIWGVTGILREFFKNKNVFVHASGYPFIFIEPTQILGYNEFSSSYGVLRASSTLLDPINFGHTMVAGMVAFAYIVRRKLGNFGWYERRTYPWILFLAAFMSLSKGAILQFSVLVLLFPYILPIPYINLLLIAGGSLAMTKLIYEYYTSHAGFAAHLSGLQASLDSASLNGLGLGRAGNYAMMLGNSTNGIGDSFFGVVFGQIGLLGGFLWLLPFLGLSIPAVTRLNFMPIVLIWTQLGVAIMSENSFNFGSIFLPIILWIGMTYGDLKPVKRRVRTKRPPGYALAPRMT